ncbi:MAG TPA: uroporphyrinogen decarboxylase family protein [Thermomicrobiales bacterium]|nr:uroporphyrinogen decarboxylase family protein [Thermomicrobiales bacterium]
MATEITSRERVLAALRGDEVDCPPVSLWKHFPERDQSAAALATSTGAWQEMLGLDFIKLMPPGDYATIDWGLRSEFRGARGGTRDPIHVPVRTAADWRSIQPVDVTRGFNAEVIRACRLVRDAVGPDLPVLQTIFSPLTIASKLSNGAVIEHLRAEPAAVHDALAIIRDVTIAVTRESLRVGASGVFFASQCSSSDVMRREEYDEFGVPYDLPVLQAAADEGSEFTLTHIHGANTFFELLAGYPAHALNWHDRRIGPDIQSVLRDHPERSAVAGIDEHAIASMTPDEVRAQVREAREASGNRRLLIGPGCVALAATPDDNLRAAVEAARA